MRKAQTPSLDSKINSFDRFVTVLRSIYIYIILCSLVIITGRQNQSKLDEIIKKTYM